MMKQTYFIVLEDIAFVMKLVSLPIAMNNDDNMAIVSDLLWYSHAFHVDYLFFMFYHFFSVVGKRSEELFAYLRVALPLKRFSNESFS